MVVQHLSIGQIILKSRKKILENLMLKLLFPNGFYDNVVRKLSTSGWTFEGDSNAKILVLANSRVAQKAGFGNLYSIF